MRGYSNPPNTPVDLGELPGEPTSCNTNDMETPAHVEQRQRRLRSPAVADLVAAYLAGARIDELAAAYGVNRTTVCAHLDRAGAPRPIRRGKLTEQLVAQVAAEHRSGVSVRSLAAHFSVDAETVRRALRRARSTSGSADLTS